MYPPRQSLSDPQTWAQKRISVARGAQTPSSRQISSAVQSFVGPFGQASAGTASGEPCGHSIGQGEEPASAAAPASAPGPQRRSSQKGLQGLLRYRTGKYRTQVASLGQEVSLQPKMVQ
jgi:hypothetical protein